MYVACAVCCVTWALRHCSIHYPKPCFANQKWKEGKTRYSQDDSIWGKEAMAKLYRELFAGNPGVLEKELVALEKPAVVATAVVL
jgi:hypothetical protein